MPHPASFFVLLLALSVPALADPPHSGHSGHSAHPAQYSTATSALLFATQTTDLAIELSTAKSDGKILAVLLEQKDCPICLELKSGIFSSPQTARQFQRHFRTVAVALDSEQPLTLPDGARQSPAQWALALGAVGTPALLFFDAEGEFLYRHLGVFANPAEFLALGQYVQTAAYETLPFAAYQENRNNRK